MFLGSPGRMVELKCPTALRDQVSERYAFQTTLEGKVKAQVVPLQRRTWDVSLGRLASPDEVGTLLEFANGGWGRGPWWFVSTNAAVVNIMPAHELSGLRETSTNIPGGPMRLAGGGWAANSLALVSGSQIRWRHTAESDPPVVPGVPVTGSAWLLGNDADVGLQWLDASGGVITTHVSAPVSASLEGVRASVTRMPPEGAVRVRLIARNAVRAARPAITYTNEVFPWGEGQGCQKAVVHAVNRDVTKAWDNPRTGRWSDLSFTVQEVG